MGYTTHFDGAFTVTPELKPEHLAYLTRFNETRRMKRNPMKIMTLPDPLREAAGLPISTDAEYYVGSPADFGQDDDYEACGIVDYNSPPASQPGLWCQWVPTADGTEIVWDEAEKFYDSARWIAYLIDHFLKPWGYKVSGEVTWQGEDDDDFGKIKIAKNKVKTIVGVKTYPEVGAREEDANG